MNANLRAARAAGDHLADVRSLARELADMTDSNAANFAEKHALRVALAKLAPSHPLVKDAALQERIKQAGRTALRRSNHWDAVRAAGATFKY